MTGAVNIGGLLVDGPESWARPLIDRLAEHLQARGVKPRLCLEPSDPELYERPGAGYLIALGQALLYDEPVLIRGGWWHLAGLGAARARMLHRAALGANAVVLRAGEGGLVAGLPTETVEPRSEPADVLARLAQVAPLANAGPGAGAWRPGWTVLLVGDRPNGLRHGQLKHRLPFVSLHGGGCSAWLAAHLEVAGIPEERLYWINASDAFDVPTPADFLAHLDPIATVALGANAARWCQEADIAYHQVAHPQHHKRFHAGEDYPLGALLRRLLLLPAEAAA